MWSRSPPFNEHPETALLRTMGMSETVDPGASPLVTLRHCPTFEGWETSWVPTKHRSCRVTCLNMYKKRFHDQTANPPILNSNHWKSRPTHHGPRAESVRSRRVAQALPHPVRRLRDLCELELVVLRMTPSYLGVVLWEPPLPKGPCFFQPQTCFLDP